MGNRIVNMVVAYVFFQYVFYDIFGKANSTLFTLYYWGVPVAFMIKLLYDEFSRPVGKAIKFYIIGLAMVILFHYLRLCYTYDPDFFHFASKLERSKPIYATSIIYLAVSVISYIYCTSISCGQSVKYIKWCKNVWLTLKKWILKKIIK